MTHDWEDETDTQPGARVTSRVRALGGGMVNIGAYLLFALGIAAFWAFFAPFLDAPAWAWHGAVLPEIAAPTEGDAVIDVSPLIAGCVCSFVAVWLR